jgi:predicted transcriptional regulator
MTPDDLRKARKDMGLTQKKLADELGMHRSAIEQMEAGKLPIVRRTVLSVKYLLEKAQ